jgi:hypothetical protein
MTIAEQPLRIAALVLLEREPERTDVVIESVPLIDALAELAPQSSSLWAVPAALSRLAELIDRTGGVRRVRYGDATQLPAAVTDILAARAPIPDRVETLTVIDPEPRSGTIARAPFSDALDMGDRIVVIAPGGLNVLDGIGPAVWLAADGVPADVLRDRVIELIGTAPDGIDADAAVADAVNQLRELGLLTD